MQALAQVQEVTDRRMIEVMVVEEILGIIITVGRIVEEVVVEGVEEAEDVVEVRIRFFSYFDFNGLIV